MANVEHGNMSLFIARIEGKIQWAGPAFWTNSSILYNMFILLIVEFAFPSMEVGMVLENNEISYFCIWFVLNLLLGLHNKLGHTHKMTTKNQQDYAWKPQAYMKMHNHLKFIIDCAFTFQTTKPNTNEHDYTRKI